MPFFFHPDIKTYHFQSSFLKKGVVNIYPFLVENKAELPTKEEFVYFPLTYFFLGGYQILASPLLGSGFSAWLFDASQQIVEVPQIFRYLFIMKLPYLILDILAAFLLASFFTNRKKKERAFVLWLFNPFTIILIYVFSNIDIIPVTLTLLSLLFAKKRKYYSSAAFLGFAAAFKAYPLIFLPWLLIQIKSVKKVILTLLTALGALLVIVLPFYSSAFQQSSLVSGLTTRIVFPGLSIGFGETLMLSIISISILFFYALLKKRKDKLWKYYLVLLLIIFSTIHIHIQWLLWAAPFVVILLTQSRKYSLSIMLMSIAIFLVPVLYQDGFMSFSLLSEISLMYNLVPLPFSFVQKFYDPFVVQSVLHSVFAGGSFMVVWRILSRNSK
jgi:hypothetical protein